MANLFVLPDWIDAELWNDWAKMRKEIKKPLTERAKFLGVHKLAELKRLGYDPSAVLEQSIFNCWTGLWPLKRGQEDLYRVEARVGAGPRDIQVVVRDEAIERMHARNSQRLAADLKRVAQRKTL